jgi:hypothetical protein
MGPSATPLVGTVEFRCPAAGTKVTMGSTRYDYLGADTNDPTICQLRNSSTGRTDNFRYALFLASNNEDASFREAFRKLYPLQQGKSVSATFNRVGGSSGESWTNTWTVRGESTFLLDEQKRPVIVLAREQRGNMGNTFYGNDVYLIDKETLAPLAREIVSFNFRGFGTTYRATDLSLPK